MMKPIGRWSGKATIIRSEDAKITLFGDIYEINDSERLDLDRCEGRGYLRDLHFVVTQMDNREELVTTTYVAEPDAINLHLKPYNWYKKLVTVGARQNNLPEFYISWLESFQSITDPNKTRKSRLEALRVLGKLDEKRHE